MGKWRSAAEAVLRDAGMPLHYKEITKRAMSEPSFDPGGPTPVASMGAVIYSDIRRNGDQSTFVQTGRGVFGLRGQGPPGRLRPRRPGAPRAPKAGNADASEAGFLGAAEKVLLKAGKPLHVKEIAEIARVMDFFSAGGHATAAALSSVIGREIRRNGEGSTFVRAGSGAFGLRDHVRPAKKRAGSARVGAAGRHRVMSELLFRGYEASVADRGGIIRVSARKGGPTLDAQVMTMSVHPTGAYICTIGENTAAANRSRGVNYILVLKGATNDIVDFLVLPSRAMESMIKEGRVTKNKAGYQVRIVIDGPKAEIGRLDVSPYRNNWDLGRLFV